MPAHVPDHPGSDSQGSRRVRTRRALGRCSLGALSLFGVALHAGSARGQAPPVGAPPVGAPPVVVPPVVVPPTSSAAPSGAGRNLFQADPRPAPDLPGAGTSVLSLRDAVARVARENLEIKAARHDLAAARADIIAAGVWNNPGVALNGQFLLFGAPAQGDASFNVVVDQVLPIGGQIGLRRDVARGYASAAEKEFAAIVWILTSHAREAYVELQSAQARWRLLAISIRDLERVETIITERAKNGANPVYDRVRVEVEKADLQAQITVSVADLGSARVALAQAIGRNVEPQSLLVSELADDLPEPPADLAGLVQIALVRRQEIHAAKLRAQASDLKITQIKREYFPSPDVQLGYSGWRGVPTDTGPRGGGALFVGVSIPLPLWDSGQGKVDRAASEANAARTRAEAAEVSIRREVEKAALNMRNQVDAWRSYQKNTEGQADRLRGMAEASYREGKGTIMELLDAYRTQLTLKTRAIELRSNAWRSASDLERAVGPQVPIS